MNYRIFQYALPAPPLLEDLNAYHGTQRVASVTQQFVSAPGGGTLIVFVVQTVGTATAPGGGAVGGGTKVDYRDTLSTSEFAVFTRLREERKNGPRRKACRSTRGFPTPSWPRWSAVG